MDIVFKKVLLEDRDLLDTYLDKKVYRSCEMVFPNIYLWVRYFHTEFAIVEDTLIFRSDKENGDLSITFPAGEEAQIQKALEVMFTYFKEQGKEFRMHLVQTSEYELLNQWYPNRFEIEYDRGYADYVYETEKLSTLSGKKLHGKRNHINKFKQLYPDWSYEKITKDNVEECFQMALKWRTDHECEYDPEKRAEMCVALNALRMLEELRLVGGLLRVEGAVVAFTIGEPLTEEMFVVHIEKAFADVQGAYPMINQQFVLHEVQGYLYVNREEDTGAEGLRKAKLSYRPAFLLEKGNVKVKKEAVSNDEN